jgi:hypothetical protein
MPKKEEDFPVESSTKVAALLERYPELEEVLIALAPAFAKLRNPLLRRSVAKVASISHAAAVADIPVVELINTLRSAVGQELLDAGGASDAPSYYSERPKWFDPAKVMASIDDIKDPLDDVMPLVRINEKFHQLESSEILELVTSHLPAPGIDIMKKRGFLVWCVEESPGLIRTYFRKP